MLIHHTTTPRNSTIGASDIHRCRDRKRAQIANAAKPTANTRRSRGHGKFE